MAFDVNKESKKVIDYLKKHPEVIKDFTKDPVKFLEKKTGLDLPDEQINKVIETVKKEVVGKIDAEKVAKGIDLIKGLMK